MRRSLLASEQQLSVVHVVAEEDLTVTTMVTFFMSPDSRPAFLKKLKKLALLLYKSLAGYRNRDSWEPELCLPLALLKDPDLSSSP
ncbi:hypothetical protein EYF80_051575 [Liparis tanakae]|uniref:Uncharacterized protein n=1 Tax=Liparis tanakae TaxID=230148 RepID=A0A4Z2FCZ2_9TELE|nr:hypothetical protein EYF80_051575 [Liparis tanakae]